MNFSKRIVKQYSFEFNGVVLNMACRGIFQVNYNLPNNYNLKNIKIIRALMGMVSKLAKSYIFQTKNKLFDK